MYLLSEYKNNSSCYLPFSGRPSVIGHELVLLWLSGFHIRMANCMCIFLNPKKSFRFSVKPSKHNVDLKLFASFLSFIFEEYRIGEIAPVVICLSKFSKTAVCLGVHCLL